MTYKTNITPINVLIFHDYPQLFIGSDQIDSRYLCLLVEELDYTLKYLCYPISINKLNDFIVGKIDLLSIFNNPEKEPLYILNTKNDFEFDTPEEIFYINVPDRYMPQEGFKLTPIELDDETIIVESYNRNKPIIHLRMNENDENNVSINLLSEILLNYQKIIKYAFKNVLKNINYKSRLDLDKIINYELKAFAASPGSFNIHLESSSTRDLFGDYDIKLALNNIDELITNDFNRDYIIKKLISNRGHFINSFSNILEIIITKNISLTYNWSIPRDRLVIKKTLTIDYAKKVYDLIKEKTELGIEERILIGNVVQADVEKGNWRMVNNEDKNEYKGISKVSLSGIILKEQTYKFTCQEILEEENISGKEKTILELVNIEEVNI